MSPWSGLLAIGDVFVVSLLASAVGAYPIYLLLLKLKSRQSVSEHLPEHQRKQGTPTMGGLIVLFGTLAGLGFFLAAQSSEERRLQTSNGGLIWNNFLVWAAIALLVGFGLIGFIDDFLVPRLIRGKRGLGWKQKIVMQVVVAGLGSGIEFGWDFGIPFWIGGFLILFFANAYNFADGLDGLAGSLLIGFGVGLGALTLFSAAASPITAILVAMIAAAIPFLFLNAHPAKVFMGDVGALPIGACLGLLVTGLLIERFPLDIGWEINPRLPIPVLVLSLVMIWELVPVPLQILSVKLRGKRLFTRTPIHHAFEARGWPESRIVWTFALAQLVLSVLALYIYLQLLGFAVSQ